MTRAHKLLTGGLWLLLATGCGGDTPDQPPGWAVEERADQATDLAPDQAVDQPVDQPVADMGEDLGEDLGAQCEAPCAPVGCGQEIRCGAPEPGLTPCPAPEWGALETPRYRCGCATGRCEPTRCLNTGECAADELCLRASPSGMSPMLGACIQTTCDALTARYDAITEHGACRQDSDCALYLPSYECCRATPILAALTYEAEKLDAYIQRAGCDAAIRRQCEVIDCAPPREARCDQATGRCALSP